MKRIVVFTFCLYAFTTQAQNKQLDSLHLQQVALNKCTPVKDQANSSTCWSFAGNSLIESDLLKQTNTSYDLSEMFIARFSYIRKIKQHLKMQGTNFFTPGGQFHDIAWVITNYGIVPEAAYTGRPDGKAAHNHDELDTIIKLFIKNALQQKKQVLSATDSIYINEQLDKYLGSVPASFIYEGKKYTPVSYAKEVLHFNAADYIEITAYIHHPPYSWFVLEDKYNWTGDNYYNVTLDDFSRIIDHALTTGYTVDWDGAAHADGFDFENGLAISPDTASNITTERQLYFTEHEGSIDHMMHIVGLAKDKDGHKWYYVKNSWGTVYNILNGYLYMQDRFLLLNTPAIIVNKKALPDDIKKKLKIQ